MIKTLFRWEQDGHGGAHGTATYFPGTPHEISLRIDSFKEANALYTSIETALRQKHWDARAGPAAGAVPNGWKHDCAALLTNDVELWIDNCPHCGKPRPAAIYAARAKAKEGGSHD